MLSANPNECRILIVWDSHGAHRSLPGGSASAPWPRGSRGETRPARRRATGCCSPPATFTTSAAPWKGWHDNNDNICHCHSGCQPRTYLLYGRFPEQQSSARRARPVPRRHRGCRPDAGTVACSTVVACSIASSSSAWRVDDEADVDDAADASSSRDHRAHLCAERDWRGGPAGSAAAPASSAIAILRTVRASLSLCVRRPRLR